MWIYAVVYVNRPHYFVQQPVEVFILQLRHWISPVVTSNDCHYTGKLPVASSRAVRWKNIVALLKPLKCGTNRLSGRQCWCLMWCVFSSCCLHTLRTKADCGWHESDRPAPNEGDGSHRPCFILPTQAACNFQNGSQILALKALNGPSPRCVTDALKVVWALTWPEITWRGPSGCHTETRSDRTSSVRARGPERPAWGERLVELAMSF